MTIRTVESKFYFPCGQAGDRTDTKKLVVAFRNFANTSKYPQIRV